MKTAVITDSSANLPEAFVKRHKNLFVLPLMIMIDNESYRDQVDIDAKGVYEKLDSHKVTTSLPSMEELSELLEELKKKGYDDVLVISISSGLSGTFNAMRLVLEQEEELNITHYDSKTLGAGLGYLVEHALELIDEDKPLKEIIPRLDQLRYADSLAIYTIETLKYLRRGGRIGKVEGTIGDVLRVKPVITVNDDGVYVTLSKSWGINRALRSMKEMLVEKFGEELIDLTVHYGSDSTKAGELGEKLKNELNIRTVTLTPLTPVLGIHTGPDMFAYVARRIR